MWEGIIGCTSSTCVLYHNFNVENVVILRCKWNEAVSNRVCNVSNSLRNTCATSHVTADNSRSMAYLIKSFMQIKE
jgi:hypothetical protein